VGGLTGALGNLSQQDIRKFFSPFGEIVAIELPKDPISGQNKGHSIVEFQSTSSAKQASQTMDAIEISPGQKLKVNILADNVRESNASNAAYAKQEDDLGEDTTHTYLHSAQARAQLMQKLMGQKEGAPTAQLNTLNPG
jgi:RNA-binding protein 23/39